MVANTPQDSSNQGIYDALGLIQEDLRGIKTDVSGLKTDVNTLSTRVDTLSTDIERSNDKFDTYQKATQWVVQLAFTLIAIATITVIISSVLNR